MKIALIKNLFELKLFINLKNNLIEIMIKFGLKIKLNQKYSFKSYENQINFKKKL